MVKMYFLFIWHNARERELNSKLIVEMNGNQTTIKAPQTELDKEASKMFAFDYSYWSFDGYHEEEDGYFTPVEGSNYCDQRRIFNDLGQDILNNAFDGFNSAIFAYGQTGSGSKQI